MQFAACLLILTATLWRQHDPAVLLPVKAENRRSIIAIRLTDIGNFGLERIARPGIPAHHHTGIDIRRPGNNYLDEPIYSVSAGVVISKRTDGAYAQLIIEHERYGERFWTVYEHIAGINVSVGDRVDSRRPIARFMNTGELNRLGWQFDHFHFEVLRQRPMPLQQDPARPERFFSSYTLACHTPHELHKYFRDPMEFFRNELK